MSDKHEIHEDERVTHEQALAAMVDLHLLNQWGIACRTAAEKCLIPQLNYTKRSDVMAALDVLDEQIRDAGYDCMRMLEDYSGPEDDIEPNPLDTPCRYTENPAETSITGALFTKLLRMQNIKGGAA